MACFHVLSDIQGIYSVKTWRPFSAFKHVSLVFRENTLSTLVLIPILFLTSKIASMTPWPFAAAEGDISESVMITRRNSKTHFLAGCVISIVLDKCSAADWDCAALCLSLSLSDSSWYNKINQMVDSSLLRLAIHVVYLICMYLVLHPLLTKTWSILQSLYKCCRLLNLLPHYQTVSYRLTAVLF